LQQSALSALGCSAEPLNLLDALWAALEMGLGVGAQFRFEVPGDQAGNLDSSEMPTAKNLLDDPALTR